MNFFTIFLRGLFMGVCDLIPGISGGTIAFITGIYDRLMTALSNISRFDVKAFFSGKFKESLKPLDLGFLLTLGAGIATAVYGLSKFVIYAITHAKSPVYAFFAGLIFASALFLSRDVKHSKSSVHNLLGGVVLGIVLSLVVFPQANPGYSFIFLGGFIAVTAMFLPGISGSFMLLLMGLYVSTLKAIYTPDFTYLLVFGAGAILSVLVSSRAISYLLKHRRNTTFSFLLGLMMGSLFLLAQNIELSAASLLIALAGFLTVFLINTKKL